MSISCSSLCLNTFLHLYFAVSLFIYLLAVLQDALLGADAALGAGRVGLPFAALHIDVHVELPAKHGHLGLSEQTNRVISRHLDRQAKRQDNESLTINLTCMVLFSSTSFHNNATETFVSLYC